MQKKIFEDLKALSYFFGDWLKHISQQHAQINVALSGGSTPKAIFNLLGQTYKNTIDWNKIHFFWGDERCVPPSHEESNYNMTRQYLFDNVTVPSENIFRVMGEYPPTKACTHYTNIIDKNLPKLNGLPSFDVVLLGMGDDGHTASIFPHEITMWNSPNICEVATHPQNGQKRITLTGSVINNANQILFLVTGKNKAVKISEIFHKKGNYIKYPASRVDPSKTLWLIDREAASLLHNPST